MRALAIFCADLHLSHTPPTARSAEPDWYEAMARPLRQLKELRQRYGCPVVCAGDVFDRWNSPPELINWAGRNLPRMYAIPGQHDLPYHDYRQLEKSAYWTLVEMGVLTDCSNAVVTVSNGLKLVGFPWGADVQPLKERQGEGCQVALVHGYVWKQGSGYPGAPQTARVEVWLARLRGYDLAVFGDNHRGFSAPGLFNCGCLVRRKLDERRYKPSVGLLLEDGTVKRLCLDCEEDKWSVVDGGEAVQAEADGGELAVFMDKLGALGAEALDFRQAVLRYMDAEGVEEGVRRLILEALGEK